MVSDTSTTTELTTYCLYVELKVDKFSLVARVGFIGYTKNDNTDVSAWGMDFDGNNISLGVYYNF